MAEPLHPHQDPGEFRADSVTLEPPMVLWRLAEKALSRPASVGARPLARRGHAPSYIRPVLIACSRRAAVEAGAFISRSYP